MSHHVDTSALSATSSNHLDFSGHGSEHAQTLGAGVTHTTPGGTTFSGDVTHTHVHHGGSSTAWDVGVSHPTDSGVTWGAHYGGSGGHHSWGVTATIPLGGY